ncbi:MAG TPA: alanine--tRNA ligase [Pirellulales bacterium]
MKTDELREKYLAFFESKGCVRKPSDVLVPTWDPSVLFTPAGMNQFKDHFLGKCKLEFTRATTCQKCLRTGDIDNVGRTAYHHTFFEMLGNFSFGDYFKKEAIHWAWEFLTSKSWLGLAPAKLSVTVYLDDDEAFKIWRDEIGVPESRITRCGEDENFWPAEAPSKGPDGVCGPCSEIYYETAPGKKVEIWNLVFTQFNRVGDPPNNLRPLPSKNIDTGMGLERCASVLQGVDTNYHIDTLKPIVLAAAEVCERLYEPDSDDGRRLRRITDHVRACTFAIHENTYPGPKEAPYVIRRLMRRAILDGYQMGRREPFLYKLVPNVVEAMKKPYPEITETVERVQNVMKKEETEFLSKIGFGLNRLDAVFGEMRKQGRSVVDGEESFDLYQTHGFPPELFETIAADHGFTFDWSGYREAMKRHGVISNVRGEGALFPTGPVESLKRTAKATEFVGYDNDESSAKVVGLVAGEHVVDSLNAQSGEAVVVLDRSPFYAEMGGQLGDQGLLVGPDFEFKVTDTKKDGDLWLHLGRVLSGTLKAQQTVTAKVDVERRDGIRRAHSATHILHHALQHFLGSHAQQKGSKVDRDLLRFDFTNMAAVEPETLAAIETEVNRKILAAESVSAQTLPIAEARQAGAMMLFGEKYPEHVRMVSMGGFSKELCGGTHVTNTGRIGLFKILSEESVSSGTRRITAATGLGALDLVRKFESQLHDVANTLRAPADEIPARVASLAKEVRDLKKKLQAGVSAASLTPEQLLEQAADVDGVKVVAVELPGATSEGLRTMLDQLRRKGDPVAALLASRTEDSVTFVVGVSRGAQERGFDSVKWVKSVVPLVDGKGGGGRPDLAQGGGKSPAKLPAALTKAVELIREQVAAGAK